MLIEAAACVVETVRPRYTSQIVDIGNTKTKIEATLLVWIVIHLRMLEIAVEVCKCASTRPSNILIRCEAF